MLSREEWSIPKVMPVVKPEVFSMDGLIAWLETMPADEHYNYHDCSGACLYGQYTAAHGHSWDQLRRGGFMLVVYQKVASQLPHTFGAALSRARAQQRGQ